MAAPPSLDDRRIANPHAMTPKPGFWIRRLARRFERVEFRREFVADVLEAQRTGVPIYVLDRQSLLDLMYLNYACLRFGLPLAYFVNGLRTLLLRPVLAVLGYAVRRLLRITNRRVRDTALLSHGLRHGRPALLFLRRRRGLSFGGVSVIRYLKTLIEVQRTLDRPLLLLPQILVWTQQPDRYRRSLIDLVFGDPFAPGRIRKLAGFLRNFRHAFVQQSEILDLRAFIADNADVHDTEQLALRLRWTLHHRMHREDRTIRGPVVKSSRQIRQEIVRSVAVDAALGELGQHLGRPAPAVRKEFCKDLREIAANFSGRMLEAVVMTLTLIWNRIYAAIEVDEAGLQRLREAGRRGPVIFVPAHRSHVDYLAISYLLYTEGLLPPHITAGINLSFWPMGAIFRRCGAFFIRRRFKGDRIYSEALRAYVAKLLAEGYWIEFFIEGTRSRTGKSLAPRYGILNLITDAVFNGATPDVSFVPCTIGYERIIEERSYIRELSGHEKHAENIAGLLRTSKVLAANYGGLYTRFGAPISFTEYMRQQGVEPGRAPDDETRRRLIERLGFTLVHGINRATVVTPSALVAAALVCHPRPGISRQRLLMRVGFLLGLVMRRDAPVSRILLRGLAARRVGIDRANAEATADVNDGEPPFAHQKRTDLAQGEAVREAVDRVIAAFVRDKLVLQHRYDDDLVYTPNPQRRINLDIYKNSLVHIVVPEAIAATAVLACARGDRVHRAAARRGAKFVSRLLRHEFTFDPERPFETVFADVWQDFAERGLIEPGPDGDWATIHPSAGLLLQFLRNHVMALLESYWVSLGVLAQLGPDGETERDLVRRIQKHADRALNEGRIRLSEAISSENFHNAIRWFGEAGLLQTHQPDGAARPVLRLARRPSVCRHWASAIRRYLPGSAG